MCALDRLHAARAGDRAHLGNKQPFVIQLQPRHPVPIVKVSQHIIYGPRLELGNQLKVRIRPLGQKAMKCQAFVQKVFRLFHMGLSASTFLTRLP